MHMHMPSQMTSHNDDDDHQSLIPLIWSWLKELYSRTPHLYLSISIYVYIYREREKNGLALSPLDACVRIRSSLSDSTECVRIIDSHPLTR